jgi:hypothetical protein
MTIFRALDNLAKKDLFEPYVSSVKIPQIDSSRTDITSVSTIPNDVPLETLIAVTIYRPGIVQGTLLQKSPQTLASVQNALAIRLQQTGFNISDLSKFKPSVFSGTAIQGTGGTPASLLRRLANGERIPLNARELLLKGLDPATRQLVNQLQDLKLLKLLQDRIQKQTDRLEQQISRYTSIFNALVNAPDAAVSGSLTFLINKIDQLEQLYNAAKAVFLLVKKAYENTKKAIIKALFTDIPRFRKNVKKSIDVLRRILKLREVPRVLKFPKIPKIPKITFSFSDFYKKYKVTLRSLKNKNSQFYDKAYQTALQQSGFEIFDPNKDKVQNSLRRARNALRQARSEFQAKQAIRTQAVERVRNDLINNVRHVNRTVERERQNILKQYQKAKTAQEKISQQIGERKEYLTNEVVATLSKDNAVDVRQKNIFGDLPYSTEIRIGGGTLQVAASLSATEALRVGYKISDGRVVYTDRTNNKAYVIQSVAERLQNARQEAARYTDRVANRAIANLGEIATAANTIKNLTDSYGSLTSGLNNKALKQDLIASIANEGRAVNRIAQEAANLPNIEQLDAPPPQQQVIVNQETKTITTISRRLRPNDALVEAEILNRQKAIEIGYSSGSLTEGTPPIPKSINGQVIYEAKLAITYVSQSLEGRGRQIGLGTGRTSTTIIVPPPAPVLSIPQSVILSAQDALLPADQKQLIAENNRRIAEIDNELLQTVNLDGSPISGEQRASLRAERLNLEDQNAKIRRGNVTTPRRPEPRVEILPNIQYPGGVYQRNSRGNNVKLIQERLNRIVRPTPLLQEDGIFGNATFNAVLQLQQQSNNVLVADGRVGRNTWEYLFRLPVILPGIPTPTALIPEFSLPDTSLTNVRVPLPPLRLPEDRVEQLDRIIVARVSGPDLQNTINRARNLTENRARQSGFSETPRVDAEFEQTRDLSGRTIYNVVFTADYIIRGGQVSGEDLLEQRQLEVNTLLQRGFTPAQINSQFSPPGPVDESGNVLTSNASIFTRTSATANPTRPATPRSPGTSAPPPQIVPGGDIAAIPKLSIFEINALQNRLASPFISDEEKVRIREILGVSQQISTDLTLPQDPQLEFSQEVTRPNLNVSFAGNRAKLSFNAGRVVNVEYSLDNGTTYTPVNPPARAGDILLDNLENGVYAARVRGIRADGTRTAPSQPKALVIRASEPRILRTEPESATSVIIIFDDPVSSADISRYQFTTRSDNSLWIDALSATNERRVVRSPILAYALEENKTYTVRIRAVYPDGTFGNPSNSATFTTFKTARQGGGLIA